MLVEEKSVWSRKQTFLCVKKIHKLILLGYNRNGGDFMKKNKYNVIIILSILLVLNIGYSFKQYTEIQTLKKENIDLKKSNNELSSLIKEQNVQEEMNNIYNKFMDFVTYKLNKYSLITEDTNYEDGELVNLDDLMGYGYPLTITLPKGSTHKISSEGISFFIKGNQEIKISFTNEGNDLDRLKYSALDSILTGYTKEGVEEGLYYQPILEPLFIKYEEYLYTRPYFMDAAGMENRETVADKFYIENKNNNSVYLVTLTRPYDISVSELMELEKILQTIKPL